MTSASFMRRHYFWDSRATEREVIERQATIADVVYRERRTDGRMDGWLRRPSADDHLHLRGLLTFDLRCRAVSVFRMLVLKNVRSVFGDWNFNPRNKAKSLSLFWFSLIYHNYNYYRRDSIGIRWMKCLNFRLYRQLLFDSCLANHGRKIRSPSHFFWEATIWKGRYMGCPSHQFFIDACANA